MFTKIVLSLILGVVIGFEVLFILIFGEYISPNSQKELLDTYQSFGQQAAPYTLWVFAFVKTKMAWSLPMIGLFYNAFLIINETYKLAIVVLLINIFITVAFYWAVYNPALFNAVII